MKSKPTYEPAYDAEQVRYLRTAPPDRLAEEFVNAVRHPGYAEARYIVDCGLDLSHRDALGRTPLHFAVEAAAAPAVYALLEAGADPAAKDSNGNTPLHIAARFGHAGLIATLSKGVDMEATNNQAFTPLMEAAANDHPAAALALVEAGANPEFRGAGGMSMMHVAAANGGVILPTLRQRYSFDYSVPDDDGRHSVHDAADYAAGYIQAFRDDGVPVMLVVALGEYGSTKEQTDIIAARAADAVRAALGKEIGLVWTGSAGDAGGG